MGEIKNLTENAAVTRSDRTTQRLAEFVCDTTYDDLSAATVTATKRIILDTLAVTIAAWNSPTARALLKLKRDQGGTPEASLVVDGDKLPAQSAAFVHAQLGNLLDADETLNNRTHFACATVMSALAMAEKTGASGQDLIAAVAVAFDVNARVGLSLRQYVSTPEGGVIFAPLFGFSWMSFGAAAAAGRLIGIDADRMSRAFGQAFVTTPLIYSILAQNRPFYRLGDPANWHKYQMSGTSAEAGINAALLAADGFVAQADVFDEGSEFWRSFGAVGCDCDIMYGDLGRRWYIAETSIKPYPFCRFGHAALDLFAGLLREHKLAMDDIESVTVTVAPLEQLRQLCENAVIDEPLKLMVSLPSAMALVARGVVPGPQWFDADFCAPWLRDFAARIHTKVNQEWGSVMVEQINAGGIFRRIPTEVLVRAHGREYRAHSDYAHGDPWADGYAMTDARLCEKVYGFTDGLLPKERTEALISAAFGLDDAADLSALLGATCR